MAPNSDNPGRGEVGRFVPAALRYVELEVGMSGTGRMAFALLVTVGATFAGAAEEYPTSPPGFVTNPAFVPPQGADPVDPPVPTIALRVRVPATAGADEELQYNITVENTSRAGAHHVAVRNPLPANVRFVRATPEPNQKDPELRWNFGTLEPGARKEIVLVVKPTGPGDVQNCARVQFEHGQCVTTRVGNAPAPTPAPISSPPLMPKPVPISEGKADLRLRIAGPRRRSSSSGR